MTPIAKAKRINSPPGISFAKFLLFNQFQNVWKNLGMIKRAISALLDSVSKRMEKVLKNVA
jgi:hypothetical protein